MILVTASPEVLSVVVCSKQGSPALHRQGSTRELLLRIATPWTDALHFLDSAKSLFCLDDVLCHPCMVDAGKSLTEIFKVPYNEQSQSALQQIIIPVNGNNCLHIFAPMTISLSKFSDGKEIECLS